MGNYGKKHKIKKDNRHIRVKFAIIKRNRAGASERNRDNKVVCKELCSGKVFVGVGKKMHFELIKHSL